MLTIYCYLQSLLANAKHIQRDERGLSQSTENAILLAGAVVIAGIIITVITQFVSSNLPS